MQAKQMELGVPRTTEGDLRRRRRPRGRDEYRVRSRITDSTSPLRRNPMMRHLIEALERGEDIGHYGRLVLVMVGHHFVGEEALVALLTRNPGVSEEDARAMCRQVEERDYNPPSPERIAEWQASQSFAICPEGDPRQCNVYRDLRFPERVYAQIREFYKTIEEAR